jgi:excisionase family DNA binding protein
MEILTVDELAELLRLSRNRIVLMARNGDIPALMLDGRLRFNAIEIENWINQNRVKSRSPNAQGSMGQ